MTNITQASARAEISVADAAAIAAATGGGDPGLMARGDLQSLLGNSALVLDGQRRRPRYFDGRFLTAPTRRGIRTTSASARTIWPAPPARVINGLRVGMTGLLSRGGDPDRARPRVTPTGDIVAMTQALTLTPVDLPTVEARPRDGLAATTPAAGRRTGSFC